ncbi:hypothetical protein CIB48_g12228 [Xylaria polymorpha]|nr:hypothetical protein CIB48_g12228 [Xylaria polymorpha]
MLVASSLLKPLHKNNGRNKKGRGHVNPIRFVAPYLSEVNTDRPCSDALTARVAHDKAMKRFTIRNIGLPPPKVQLKAYLEDFGPRLAGIAYAAT